MKNKFLPQALLLLAFLSIFSNVFAQSKIILDKHSAGGYCNQYFDLDENGFALVFNKDKDADAGAGSSASILNNVYYYSKDLVKRANFKVTSTGNFSLHASKNNIFVVDRLSTKYHVRVLDYAGKEIANKKFDLEQIGLNQDLISKIYFTSMGQMIFEVYDGRQQLHIYQIHLIEQKEDILTEIDIALPSANPLEKMAFTGNWTFLGESMGYFILARKGSNSEYDPSAIAYHIAFYDENFGLFRELLLDNFLLPNTNLIGKEATLSLNTSLQSFVVSGLINRDDKPGFMVANYGMELNSNVMRLFWYKELNILQNEKYHLIENDGISVPNPPVIIQNGQQIQVSIVKGRTNLQEEAINQLCLFDANGNLAMNAIQMGNFEGLNLDGFCVDNDELYSRIKKLQIATILKPYCDKSTCEVLDIDIDPSGNELAIVRDGNINVNQVAIYRFTKK